MIGEDGGIQWGALHSYNFALSLLIVTTNVVVSCEYLPQKFPLWGTIKGYCIVLYCIVLYCTVLYCTVLYCTVLYCTVLYCTVLYCTVLYCIVLYCVLDEQIAAASALQAHAAMVQNALSLTGS